MFFNRVFGGFRNYVHIQESPPAKQGIKILFSSVWASLHNGKFCYGSHEISSHILEGI